MKASDKCRQASPRPLDRLVKWLGFECDLHVWHEHEKQHGNTIFFCRSCECGIEQVRSAGPLGDGKWRDISAPWRWKWEKEQFENARLFRAPLDT